MTVTQEIERQEQELSELLARVMHDPLAPVSASIKEMDQRMMSLEALVQDLRDADISVLHLHAEDANKQFRALKSLLDDSPRQLARTVQPWFDGLSSQVEHGKQETWELLREGGAHTSAQLAGVAGSVADSQHAVHTALQENGNEIKERLQTTSALLQTRMAHHAADLSKQSGQQITLHDQAFGRVHDSIEKSSMRLQEDAVVTRRQLEQKIVQMATSMAEMRTLFDDQGGQLALLKQQQIALSADTMQQAKSFTRSIGISLLTASIIICSGMASAAWFLSGKI